jgi:hypothetical protein
MRFRKGRLRAPFLFGRCTIKVSLTISGSVAETIVYWNDGTTSDVYVVQVQAIGNGTNFAGEAKVTNDVAIGFCLSLEIPAAGTTEGETQLDRTAGGRKI